MADRPTAAEIRADLDRNAHSDAPAVHASAQLDASLTELVGALACEAAAALQRLDRGEGLTLAALGETSGRRSEAQSRWREN